MILWIDSKQQQHKHWLWYDHKIAISWKSYTFGKYLKGINKGKGGQRSPKCRTGERDGNWEFLFGTDAAEFTEHSAKDQGGTKLGNTHRHILLVEKIIQGRFPSCASLLVTSRSVQQQIVSIWKLMLLAWNKIHIRFCWCWLNKLWQCGMLILKPCGDFVLTQVSNADDQNVVFHLLRLPTMPVTLDDQRKRHKKAKETTITPNTSRLLLQPTMMQMTTND